MNKIFLFTLIIFLQLSSLSMSYAMNQTTDNKIVIAHRGASGYLPEHSIASKAMAYAMGADYIEQDVVMTKDDQLIILHDPYLDRVTNVMTVFPKRSREVFGQQRWLAIDFTLAEIKSLQMTEAFSVADDEAKTLAPNFPQRFPLFKSSFHVSTLAEEIELIQGLNKSTGKNVGIYVEIKTPWFHLTSGKDISQATLALVKSYGYTSREDKIFIQCFDPDELKRIKEKLMPELDIDLRLVQLIAETDWNETMRLVDGKLTPYSYDWMFESGAMKKLAEFADGVGPWKPMLVSDDSTLNNLIISDMVKEAKAAGLLLHPYTFRADEGRVPAYAGSFEELLNIFYFKVGVDGVFTDFPDKAVNFLKSKK